MEDRAPRDAEGPPTTDRRRFLGGASSAVVASLLLMPRVARAASVTPVERVELGPPDGTFATEEALFREFSRIFTVTPRELYFAVAQKGSMPVPILRHYKEGLDQIARDPFPVYLEPSAETRARIARCYGARTDEIAISRNTTDGVSMVLSGLPWAPGDELLTSTMEYPNCVATMLRVARRFGVRIREFGVPMHAQATAQEIVESARRQIRPGRTKVLFFSAITQSNGQRLPLRGLARLAQQYGIVTVVDGAHYGGMLDPRLDETGVDFMAISGHKWQCGPGGTGVLYVRNARHPANAAPLPRFHIVRSGDLDAPLDGSRPSGFDIGAALSLYGFPESADWRALGEVIELWDVVGRQRIADYDLALADYLRQRLVARFGDECLLQPTLDPELKTGIVCFTPFAAAKDRRDATLADAFAATMYTEHGYRIGHGGLDRRGLTRPPAPDTAAFYPGCIPNRDPLTNAPLPSPIPFRADACFWLTRSDVDRFVDACDDGRRRVQVRPTG